jgi:diguanylate cyclase (GGDEF)-like protein
LIESLFKGASGNSANVFAYVLLGAFLEWTASALAVRAASILIMIAGVARIAVERGRRLDFQREGWLATTAEVEASELGYRRIITMFALSLGVLEFAVILGDPSIEHQSLVLAAALIFVVSSPGRCCGSPRTVATQAASIVAPFCVAFAIKGGPGDYFAILMGLAVWRHLRDTTRSLHGTLVSMLMARRAAEDVADKFDTALNNMSGGLVMIDRDRRVQVANQRFAEIFGLQAAPVDLPVDRLLMIVAPLLKAGKAMTAMAEFFAGRGGSDGQWRLTDGRILALSRQPMPQGSVITVADVTAEHEAERNIQRMARFDQVTGLPNRAFFTEMLDKTIGKAKVGDGFSLLSVDLDRFKEVNDAHGHHVGDLLLAEVAERMRTVVDGRGFVARFGGDEFVILLEAARSETIAKIGASIIRAVAAPFEIEGKVVRIGASAGAAIFPRDAPDDDAATLLKAADMALYDAKASGRGAVKFFVEDMAFAVRRRRQLGVALRDALANDELSLAYQPIVDLVSGHVTAVEALLRWNTPQFGAISPVEFIPVAEETGVIVEIGVFALESACRDAVAWPADVRVAVNLSAVQFDRGDLEATVRAALAAAGLPPERLELEITESILIGNHASALEKLNRLHGLGVHIALDDFGTGYSSLSYLHDFNFDKVKIDQSFVRDVNSGKNCKAASIIRAVNAIARDLNMAVVAEGVETIEQIAALRALGVFGAQGYYFSRPTPAAELGVYLLGELARRGKTESDAALLPRAG